MLRMDEVEEEVPFRKRIPKLLWRGVLETAPTLRGDLLAATASKPWADVRAINWSDPNSFKHDIMSIQDHCRYSFLAYTEGMATPI